MKNLRETDIKLILQVHLPFKRKHNHLFKKGIITKVFSI